MNIASDRRLAVPSRANSTAGRTPIGNRSGIMICRTTSGTPCWMMAERMDLGPLIMEWLDELAEYSEDPAELTRRYLTPEHARAAEFIMRLMREAGMSARLDAVGNVVGSCPGAGPTHAGSSSARTRIRYETPADSTARSVCCCPSPASGRCTLGASGSTIRSM